MATRSESPSAFAPRSQIPKRPGAAESAAGADAEEAAGPAPDAVRAAAEPAGAEFAAGRALAMASICARSELARVPVAPRVNCKSHDAAEDVSLGIHQIEFGLQLGNLRLRFPGELARLAGRLPPRRGELGLNRQRLRIELLLQLGQSLRGPGGIRSLRDGRGLSAEKIRIGARDVEGQSDDLVGGLPQLI